VVAAREEGQAGRTRREWTPQIKMGVPVLIPDTISRTWACGSASTAAGTLVERAEIDGFAAELIDRFGKLARRGQEPARGHRHQAEVQARQCRPHRRRPQGRGDRLPRQPGRQRPEKLIAYIQRDPA